MTRNKHYIAGRMAAGSGATIGNAAANLWNPAANARIFVYEVWVCDTAATAMSFALRRSTARGATPGATVTAAQDHSIERDVAAPAAFILDLAGFGTQPTVGSVDLARWNLAAAAGNGVILPFPDPLSIPPGTGLAIVTAVAVAAPICDVTFVVGD